MPITTFIADLRAASRHLTRSPGFSLLATATLALGITAVATVYLLLNGILLRPLPYAEPQNLVGIEALNPAKSIIQPSLSASDFRDLAGRTRSLSVVGACRPDFANMRREGDQNTVELPASLVTEHFFDVFGVRPMLGRSFQPSEFFLSSARTVVLSDRAWRARFASDPQVIGRNVTINRQPHTIIGVMPPSFREPAMADVWLPFPKEAPEYFARDSRYWTTIGRLAPGQSARQVQAETDIVAADLAMEYPETNRNWSMRVTPLQELRVSNLKLAFALLSVATVLILIIACLNLSNLLLARGTRRLSEMAVRQAVGATPAALFRQMILENILISCAGGVAGIATTALFVPRLIGLIPSNLLPRQHEIGLDGTTVLVVAGVAVFAGLCCGLFPALQAIHAPIDPLLREGGNRSGTSPRMRRLRSLLVGCQLAVAVTVLTAAGWLVSYVSALRQVAPGFNPDNVLSVHLAPTTDQYDTNLELALYYEKIIDVVKAVPGVDSAGINASAPLTGITLRYPFWLYGHPRDDGNSDEAVFAPVSADYFKTLRTRLIEGRGIEPFDTETGAPVAVINASLARRLFPGRSAIGERVQLVPWISNAYRQIVGVVADSRQDNLSDPPPAQIYVPQRQMPWFFSTLLIRLDPKQPASVEALKTALQRADPGIGGEFTILSDSIAATAGRPRLYALLFTGFGIVALALTAFGIYANVAFSVSQRTREFGLRMALGATPRSVIKLILGETGLTALCGCLVGLACTIMVAQGVRVLLPGASIAYLAPALSASLVMSTVALFAAGLPAYRASTVHPASSLQTR